MAADPNNLLWVDMEMSGLDPDTEKVLEIAIVVTDSLLNTVVEAPGLSHGVQVNLTPLGARLLTGVPMHTLTNRSVALADLARPARELTGQLQAAQGWEARFALLDRHLLRRLAAADPPSEGVAWAWQELRRSHGAVNIRALREALGWSHQALVARFREDVGLAPKAAARLLPGPALPRKA